MVSFDPLDLFVLEFQAQKAKIKGNSTHCYCFYGNPIFLKNNPAY